MDFGYEKDNLKSLRNWNKQTRSYLTEIKDTKESTTESKFLFFERQTSGEGWSLVVPVKLDGQEILAIVDTGAQHTVISKTTYEKLSKEHHPCQRYRLGNAEKDTFMEGFSINDVDMQLGEKAVPWSLIVAPIADAMLLGIDFLKKYDVSINLGAAEIIAGTQHIPAKMIKHTSGEQIQIRKVYVATSVSIPPLSLTVIPVKLDQASDVELLVEPVLQNKGLLVGTGVISGAEKAMIQVINDAEHHVKLPAGHLCGIGVEFDAIGNCQEEETDVTIRTVQLSKPNNNEDLPGEKDDNTVPAHLQVVLEKASINITDVEQEEVAQLLNEFKDVFSAHEFDLGNFQLLSHKIDLQDKQPFRERMRRTPLCFQQEEEKTLKKMLDAGVIQPSESEYASAPVLIRKKDGSVRYCIDYRQLNHRTVKDAFPLPLIEECLDTLNGSVYFSSLDMASGYWQIPMNPVDRHKTAFLTKYGLFEHTRMGFGLCNAPATFSRAMNLVLRNMTYKQVLAYLDDVVVIGKTFQEHKHNLTQVLQRFRAHGLKLKPKKCYLFQKEIDFLGRRVSGKGIDIQAEKVKTIQSWPSPSSKEEVASFLGTVNYHRDFIKDYAQISEPLYKLVPAKAKFVWDKTERTAFEALKNCLMSAPILAFPNNTDMFILDCDASNRAIGAELIQVQDGMERVVGYSSYVLTPAQRKYCTTRKELLALVTFTRHFRHYLLGREFLVRTDHASLTWLLRFRHIEGQLARWTEELAQYDMVVQHRSGKLHGNADGLSRIPDTLIECDCYRVGLEPHQLPCGGCPYCVRCHNQWSRFEEDVDDVVPIAVRQMYTELADPFDEEQNRTESTRFVGYSYMELRDAQMADPDVEVIIRWLEQEPPNQAELFRQSAAVKYFWNCKSQLKILHGVLFYQWERQGNSRFCLVTPNKLQSKVLTLLHDSRAGGHYGRDKTLERLKQSFMWMGMAKDVEVFVESCSICRVNKKRSRTPQAGLGDYQAGIRLERVHLDILGPFVESTQGNRYILMIVDQFTKWLTCVALPDQSAESISNAFFDNFVCILGVPTEIHTDQGRNFDGKVFQSICDLLQIDKTRTTPYRPRSNGQVERYNRTVLQFIRCFLERKQTEWDKYLPSLGMSLRATVNRSTGYTPNFLMFGCEVNLPAEIIFGLDSCNQKRTTTSENAQEKKKILEEAFSTVRKNLAGVQLRQKRLYNQRMQRIQYEVGDIVYQLDSSTKIGQTKKLMPIFKGPYLILQHLAPALYRLTGRKSSFVAHHDKLLICKDREIPLWLRLKRHDLLGEPHELIDLPVLSENGEESRDRQDREERIDSEIGSMIPAVQESMSTPQASSMENEQSPAAPSSPKDNHTTAVSSGGKGEKHVQRIPPKPPDKTRRGRTIIQPAHFRDFEL